MNDQARIIWQTLEFRTPAIRAAVRSLRDDQMRWHPPNGANSAAWLLWHIAEVEDNWVRDRIHALPRRYPFGASVRDARGSDCPSRDALLAYFEEVRELSRERLAATMAAEFDRAVDDETFGVMDVRAVWIGVATSCAWHGGQLVLLANRLVPPGG